MFNIGVTATDSSTLGAYELESAEAYATALVGTACSAKTAINALWLLLLQTIL